MKVEKNQSNGISMCFNESTSDLMMKARGSGNSSTTIIDVKNSCMLVLTDSEEEIRFASNSILMQKLNQILKVKLKRRI
jgi:hypothetical protein